jgi:hypothetical protein
MTHDDFGIERAITQFGCYHNAHALHATDPTKTWNKLLPFANLVVAMAWPSW